jgi:uncharacterized membrane protein
MNLSTPKISVFIAIDLIIFSGLNLLDFKLTLFEILISTFTLLILPAYLLIKIFRLNITDRFEAILFGLGINLIFLMLLGLVVNSLGFIGLIEPLSKVALTLAITSVLHLLNLVNLIKAPSREWKLHFPAFSIRRLFSFMIPLLVILFAVLGAIKLNNDQGNLWAIITLGFVILLCLGLYLLIDHVSPSFILWSIFCFSLAILLMTSLRGWYLTGHDIQREYYVFQLTKQNLHWDMNYYRDAYNACLSITILPTIISMFIPIPDMYIYKVIYQIFFALSPVIVYLISRKYLSRRLSLTNSLLFVSFPTFLNDMPFLNRQELGFLYFGLILLLIFKSKLSLKHRNLLFACFSMGLVLSHYSTSYVTFALFGGGFILNTILSSKFSRRIFAHYSITFNFNLNSFIRMAHLVWFLGLILIWNTFITHTSNNLTSVAAQIYADYSVTSNHKSTDVGYSLLKTRSKTSAEILAEYVQAANSRTARITDPNNYFPLSTNSQYPLTTLTPDILPLTKFGQLLDRYNLNLYTLHSLIRSASALGIQIFFLIGLAWVLVNTKLKHGNLKYGGVRLDLELITLAISGTGLSLLMLLLPGISLDYGLLRLFQQNLYVFGIFIMIGLVSLFWWSIKTGETIGFILTLFLLAHLSGLIPNLTGDFPPQLNLDNAGIYYDAFYVHPTDIAAIHWVSNLSTNPHEFDYQSDIYGANLMLPYGGVSSLADLIPDTILKSSYVFMDYATAVKGVMVNLNQEVLLIKAPTQFLDDYKNLIYNNGSARIYK